MRSSRAASSSSRTPDQNPDPDLGQEVFPGHVPEAILIAVQVDLDLDPEILQDLNPGQGEDPGPDPGHQTFQSDAALRRFWKKGESQVHENDPFLIGARGSITKVPLPIVLTVHTPGPVDLIRDLRAQDPALDPALVLTNAISGFHGREAGVDHRFTHHETRS